MVNEQYILSRRRYLILFAAVLMQLCLGATYSWSVFVSSIKVHTGLGQGPVQLPFTLFYMIFPLTMVFSGTILLKIGPRISGILGAVLFGGGWILASLGDKNFLFTVVGIGLCGGVGVGFAYLVPLGACVRWFPNHKGLVTGLVLAGFGGGSALISQLSGYLMATYHTSAFDMFRFLGGIFMVVVALAGSVMTFPPTQSGKTGTPLPLSAVIRDRFFWLIYLTMFTGLVAGFTVNANMTKLYTGPNEKAGFWAVAFFAIGSALGRISWGLIFDKVKSLTAIRINLICQAGLILGSFWLLKSATGFELFALAAGFNYGGLLVNHASTSARHWGPEHIGQVYGWLSSSNIPAALAPFLAGLYYDHWKNFNFPLAFIAVSLIVVVLLVHREPAGESYPRVAP
jgi:MFS transporter, OFA family, oxalate/formate antiporter